MSVYAPAFSPCCSSPSSSISQTTLLLFPLFPTPVEIHEQRANIILYNYFFLYSKIKNKKSQFLFLSSWHPMTPSSQILLYFHTHSLSLFFSHFQSLFLAIKARLSELWLSSFSLSCKKKKKQKNEQNALISKQNIVLR